MHLSVYDTSLPDAECHPYRTEGRVSVGAGHVQKLYASRAATLVEDAAAYAEKVYAIKLDAYLIDYLDNALSEIICWLSLFPHPTTLEFDAILRPVIQKGPEFVKQSIKVVRICCNYYRKGFKDDDQFAIDTVAGWIEARLLSPDVAVDLRGYKYRHGDIELHSLKALCADLTDNRPDYPRY